MTAFSLSKPTVKKLRLFIEKEGGFGSLEPKNGGKFREISSVSVV